VEFLIFHHLPLGDSGTPPNLGGDSEEENSLRDRVIFVSRKCLTNQIRRYIIRDSFKITSCEEVLKHRRLVMKLTKGEKTLVGVVLLYVAVGLFLLGPFSWSWASRHIAANVIAISK
jgi:hypothetical protein